MYYLLSYHTIFWVIGSCLLRARPLTAIYEIHDSNHHNISPNRMNNGAESVSLDFNISSISQSGNVDKSSANEAEKTCPLCKSTVRYFFVNFNEKVLLCENKECEYPFGYEDLEFVKQDEQCGTDSELESITTIMSRPTPTPSIISTTAWSDIDKLNRAYDSEDSQLDTNLHTFESNAVKEAKFKKRLEEKEVELQTRKNVQQIKKLSVQLQKTYEEEEMSCIKNEKWIKHLMDLQDHSGVQLLKKEEMSRFKKTQPVLGTNELTIGINRGNAMSSITIELSNKSAGPS